ncbi:hypothetical protein HY030_02775 [Candidatus Gottesmanbacteria bacterium]|nr:hypothetical protein [Candidatus Gottesmanbacteria bacterium]
MYDSQTFDHEVSFLAFKEKILRAGVGLYNGYDSDYDPLAVGDVVLGWKVVDGYVPNNPAADINEDGQFAAWSLARKVIKRVINPEIPGKADLKIKQKVIDLVFEDLILKLF